MEGLEGEINFNILDDVIEVPPLCELSFCELLDQDTPSSITAAPGFDTEKDDTMAMYDTSSFSHETSKSNGTKAEQAEIPRERKLHRMRQRRYRQNKEKTQKTVTEKLEDARNEMRKIGKQNKKLMQENWAMSSLVDTASSMLLKMNMSISSSLSCGPHQKILLILEGLAAFRTFDHLNDEGMKIFYGTYGAQMIIRTASLYLNKRQFGKVVYIPILRTCGALMEVGDEAVLNMINKKRKLCLFVWAEEGHKHHNSITVFAMQWCIHPARRSEVERRLIDRFDRVVSRF